MTQENKNKVLNVPPLRFPEFEGEWERTTLGVMVEFLDKRRKPIKGSERSAINKIYPYYGASGIVDYIDDYIFDEPTILLSEDGANILDRNYRVAFIATGKYWVNNHAHVLKPHPEVDIYFLCEYLESKDYSIYNTGTTMPKLNQEICRGIPVFSPDTSEQIKIGALLKLLNERIAIQSKIIEKLQSLIKGLVDEIIESLDCEFIKFADIYVEAKEGGTPSTSVREYYERGTVPFIKIDDLAHKYLSSNKDYITELGMQKSSAWLIPAGSIIFSNGATIGAVSISTYPVTTKQGILGIVPKNNIDVEYLYYLLTSTYFTKEIERIVTEGTMKTAYLKDINKIMCPIPSKPIQNQISKLLSSYSQKLQHEQHILECYNCQKQCLLSQMFI